MTPQQQNEASTAMAIDGSQANRQRVLSLYKGQLAGRGIVYHPGAPEVGHDVPKFDLKKYPPFKIDKGSGWTDAIIPEHAYPQDRGALVDVLVGTDVQHVRVGTWMSYERADHRVAVATYNEHGVAVGPQITYWSTKYRQPAPAGFESAQDDQENPDQIKEIKVMGASAATPELINSKTQAMCIEDITFAKDGSLSSWTRPGDNGDTVETDYGPSGALVGKQVSRSDGSYETNTYNEGGIELHLQRIPKNRNASDPYFLDIVWNNQGDLMNYQNSKMQYKFPGRTIDLPQDAVQSVIWYDQNDKSKGPREAYFTRSKDDQAKLGPSVTWTSSGEVASEGSYTDGMKNGMWIEHGFGMVDGRERAAYTANGKYVKDVKSGAWTTILSDGDPRYQDAIKKGIQPRVGEYDYKIIELYVDGKVTQTTKSF